MTLDEAAYILTGGNRYKLNALERMTAEDARDLTDLMDFPEYAWRTRGIWAKYGIEETPINR